MPAPGLLHTATIIGLPILAYLLGSIPWGLLLTRLFTSQDILRRGSGNIGATNVSRVAGATLGILTFVGDILKGAVPVFLATIMADPTKGPADIYLSICALAAFFGHLFPIFTKLKGGGKGVATTAGCFVVLSPLACLCALLAFIIMLIATRRVSVGSLAAAVVLPVAVWISNHSAALTASAILAAAFIFQRHAANIKRLVSGTEPDFRKRD